MRSAGGDGASRVPQPAGGWYGAIALEPVLLGHDDGFAQHPRDVGDDPLEELAPVEGIPACLAHSAFEVRGPIRDGLEGGRDRELGLVEVGDVETNESILPVWMKPSPGE